MQIWSRIVLATAEGKCNYLTARYYYTLVNSKEGVRVWGTTQTFEEH